jgi:two-component system NarL family sensor kinase
LTGADQRLLQDIAGTLGAAVHAARLSDDLQRSREGILMAAEDERRRLQRDLHDGLGPELAGISLGLAAVENLMGTDPDAAHDLLGKLRTQSREAIAEIRSIVEDLRPRAIDQVGLVRALEDGLSRVAVDSELELIVSAPSELPDLPAAVEVAVYRIAMEAVTNAVKHSGAGRVEVSIVIDGQLLLTIADNGSGSVGDGHGVGIPSMRERATVLGGAFELIDSPAGLSVRVSIPVGA